MIEVKKCDDEKQLSYDNEMWLQFDSKSENERFARTVIASFVTPLDPTLEELSDIKTAVSEAVTNAIIHGYELQPGKITMHGAIKGSMLLVEVIDEGVGIPDVPLAMQTLYTSKPEQERSGMGFAFMEAFMDRLEVKSAQGEGTTVRMKKYIV